MRVALLALILALVASSAGADEPPQCRGIDRQIAHFQVMRSRAVAMDNAMWVERFDEHLARLKKHRLSQGCPDKSGAAEFARLLKALMQLAAQGAITFFTMGMM